MSRPVTGETCYVFKNCHTIPHWVVKVRSGRGYVHRVGCHFSNKRQFLHATYNAHKAVSHGEIVEVLGYIKCPARGIK